MGVYIKGMEMPKEYGPHEITITLFVREDGTASLWGKEVFIPHEPLEIIPIPPHGRLIDGDALKPYMLNEHYKYRLVYDAVEVANAPTIIPASFENPTKNARYSQDNLVEEGE